MSKLIRKLYHKITLDFLFPRYYAWHCKRPVVQNKAVFIELNLPALSGSLRVLYDEMEKQGDYQLHIHYLREAFCSKFTYIKNVLKCLKDIATASYIILCEGSTMVSCIRPRPETFITQTWHGCGAFKKFGYSTTDLEYSYYNNCDLVTVSSPEVIWAYQEAMNLADHNSIIQPLGISRTDIYFRESFHRKAKERMLHQVPQIVDKKILLYAPTFRGNAGNAQAPDALDINRMQAALGSQYLLLIKHHPLVKSRPAIPASAKDFAFDVSDSCSIEDLIVVSDFCISDYSSLVFEYSLLERPMLFFAFDLKDYNDWRGFYYDYRELAPGPIVSDTEELIEKISEFSEHFDPQQVCAFRDKFMSACDGCSTKRILEYMSDR